MSRMSDLATNDPNLRMYFGLYINRKIFQARLEKVEVAIGVSLG